MLKCNGNAEVGERQEERDTQRISTKKTNVSTTQLGLLPPAIRNFSTPENYYSSCIAVVADAIFFSFFLYLSCSLHF